MSLRDRLKAFEQVPASSPSTFKMTTQKGTPANSNTVVRTWGAPTVSAADILKKIGDNDGSLSVVDISNNAIYQMKSDEYTAHLGEALKKNTHVRELTLVNCGIGDRGGESLGSALAVNRTLTSLNLEKNSLNQDGASAIAKGLANNTTLESINLMNQTHSRWGDKCLDDFLEMFNHNITLLKINWRLESRKSFALNKMITRNNEIDRRKKNGIAFDDLLPTAFKGSDLEAQAKLGRPAGVGGKENSVPGHDTHPHHTAGGTGGGGATYLGHVHNVPAHPAVHPQAHTHTAEAVGGGSSSSANGGGGFVRGRYPPPPAGGGDVAGAVTVPEVAVKRASVLSRWPPAAAGNV